jgi:hypothetical protein
MEGWFMQNTFSPIVVFREFLLDRFKGCRAQFDEIRSAVKARFPEICDDGKLCPHEYPHRPEWEHQLRHALDYLKNKKRHISQETLGEYIFP